MQTLRWRLTLWYGGMAAAILIILATILYLSARSSLVEIRQDDVRDTADSVSQVLEETGTPASAVGNVRRKDVRTVWAIGEVRREDVQVVIRDADGGVLAATPYGAREAPEFEASDVSYPEVRRDGRYLATTFESEEVPGATGVVYTVLPTWDPVLRRLFLIEVAAVTVALALIVGFGPKLAGRALKPLGSLSTVAGELRRGRFGSRALPELKSRRDEVGELASSFDAMAESLERLFEAERESKETLRRFVADASHELRTPLTTVLGYLDVLEESGDTDPVVRHRVFQVMREEGGRMARLVEDLLVLARLDEGREMPAELVDLVALAREVVGSYPDRRIELSANDGVVPVLADPEALRRVVSNLLSNAVKHTPPENEILVTVDREDREAALRVADEGTGISEDALPHVFERFYRAESSRAGEGTGLGLAIVRETVEALEGRIEVQSTLDEGSAFTVRIPLSQKLPEREILSEKS